MTQIRISKGDAFHVVSYFVPGGATRITSRSIPCADRAEATAMVRELAADSHCSLVTMHSESGALQGFAHGPACIDLSPEGEGFTLFVPVFRADSLPEVWQAISAYDASKGEETMPGLIDLYAAHDASKAD